MFKFLKFHLTIVPVQPLAVQISTDNIGNKEESIIK